LRTVAADAVADTERLCRRARFVCCRQGVCTEIRAAALKTANRDRSANGILAEGRNCKPTFS
jgi:hypothetical protein